MIQEEITEQLIRAVRELGLPEVEFSVEHPENEGYGDWSTNVVLKLKAQTFVPSSGRGSAKLKITAQSAKVLTFKSAREIAETITTKLKSYNLPAARLPARQGEAGLPAITKIEVAGPGFINFWLSEHFLLDKAGRVLDLGERYGTNDSRKDKKIMVEYTDPNPFKEFHIGHLYSNIVGEALARLFEASGAKVARANYQGDVGLHVAKAIWGMMEKLKAQSSKRKTSDGESGLTELEKKSSAERAKFLGECYALGAKAYDEDERVKEEIEALNRKIYAQDPEILELYELGRAWSLEHFETIYKRLGTRFDHYYFERDAGKVGLAVVKQALRKGIFEESQGAVVFPGERYGLHTRVFVNSAGLPTYEAKDLGLAPTKYRDFPYDLSIIVTGNEVDEYFRVVLKALSLVAPKLGARTQHVSHGMVRLPGGKMSSRTGEVLTAEWLLDESRLRVLQIIRESGTLGEKLQAEVAEVVGLGAVKYALLRSSIGQDIRFDFDTSVSFEGNSGPYLQYTYARAKSVLRNAKLNAQNVKRQRKSQNLKFNDEERAILRWLYRYPETVAQAAEGLAPNLICGYLYELAGRFNTFYNKHRILQAKEKAQRAFRLQLTAAASQVLANGLWLLGIAAPEKM